MTITFRIKYTSCVLKIAQKTDSEMKIAKNTQASLCKATCVLFCLHNVDTILNLSTFYKHFIKLTGTTNKKSITNCFEHKLPSNNVIRLPLKPSAA